jgi:hypothetical protein
MFYKVTQEDVRKDNPSIDAVAEFNECTSAELKYMLLVYDYETPFRELDVAARKNRAAITAGYKLNKQGKHTKKTQEMIDGVVPHLAIATRVFMKLQKDIDREAMVAYNQQIEQFINKSKEEKVSDKDWELALKITDKLPKLLQSRKEIQDVLGLRGMEIEDDLEEIDHDLQLSTLDQVNEETIEQR